MIYPFPEIHLSCETVPYRLYMASIASGQFPHMRAASQFWYGILN